MSIFCSCSFFCCSWIWSSNALSKSAKSAIAFSFDPKDKDCYDFVGLTTRPWPFSLSTLGLISANPIPPVGYFPFLWPSAEPWAGEPVAIEVVRKAPAGDPFVYRVRGYEICLRSRQAGAILVEVDG